MNADGDIVVLGKVTSKSSVPDINSPKATKIGGLAVSLFFKWSFHFFDIGGILRFGRIAIVFPHHRRSDARIVMRPNIW